MDGSAEPVAPRAGRNPADEQARAMVAYQRTLVSMAQDLSVDVFVMGPHIQEGLPDDELSPGARLRKRLIGLLSGEGYAVPPDLATVIELTKDLVDPDCDLTTVEQTYAKQVDILIFIPDSNGSAAEVGYFAGVDNESGEDIGRRSLVLLDKERESKPGFVALGPARLLKENGAMVHSVSYDDLDAVLPYLREAVSRARRRKARRLARRRSGL